MAHIITGRVIKDLGFTNGVSQRTGNPWYKHSILVEEAGQIRRTVKMDIFGQDTWTGMALREGAYGNFHFSVESREFQGKYYSDVSCYRYEELTENQGNILVQEGFAQASQIQQAPHHAQMQATAGPRQQRPLPQGVQTLQTALQGNIPVPQQQDGDKLTF